MTGITVLNVNKWMVYNCLNKEGVDLNIPAVCQFKQFSHTSMLPSLKKIKNAVLLAHYHKAVNHLLT